MNTDKLFDQIVQHQKAYAKALYPEAFTTQGTKPHPHNVPSESQGIESTPRELQEEFKVIDFSAGNRAVWFNKDYPAVFIDIRPEVNPTIVADTRNLPETIGSGFDLVVFDPPHVNFGKNAEMSKTYGWHTTEEIRDLIRRSASEAHRITRENALMSFKWNDHDQKLERVLELMAQWWEPLVGNKTASRTKHSCSTTWVLLRRKSSQPASQAPEPLKSEKAPEASHQ